MPTREQAQTGHGETPARLRLVWRVRRALLGTMLSFLLAGVVLSGIALAVLGRVVLEDEMDRRLDRAVELASTGPLQPVDDLQRAGRVDTDLAEARAAAAAGAPAAGIVADALETRTAVEGTAHLGGRDVIVRAAPTATGVEVAMVSDIDDTYRRFLGYVAMAELLVVALVAPASVVLARRGGTVLEEVFRSEDRLMRSIAHDIRTPIARLVATVDEGLDGDVPGADALSDASEHLGYLATFVDDLVVVAEVLSGSRPVPRQEMDLAEVADWVAASVPTGQAVVTVDVREPAVMDGSPTLLRLALSNLVRNAARHGYRGAAGTVRIVVSSGGVAVEDDGVGIPAEDLAALRGEIPLGRRPVDTGMGVVLARWVATQHGGAFELGNRPGGGVRAALELPARSPRLLVVSGAGPDGVRASAEAVGR